MRIERLVVDNRVFLLGLDELYRESMKTHERDELLVCARETADALSVEPADVPIEGYYTEDAGLTEYFRLVRALQTVSSDRSAEVADLKSFQRLRQVTASRIFGKASGSGLLPGGKDALTIAMDRTWPNWTIEILTKAAYEYALSSDDYSLVALAALSRDPVVLAALRESVVLYAMCMAGCSAEPVQYEYVWAVDEVIQSRATHFVQEFNQLFNESLPPPTAENAKTFWNAADESKLVGRCVRIGFNDGSQPIEHYYWAIDYDESYKLVVKDFWDSELWTTARYRKTNDLGFDFDEEYSD
jgi:hypothetical protein